MITEYTGSTCVNCNMVYLWFMVKLAL